MSVPEVGETYRQENVRHVHGDEHRDTDVGERDEVAPSDEPQGDRMLVRQLTDDTRQRT